MIFSQNEDVLNRDHTLLQDLCLDVVQVICDYIEIKTGAFHLNATCRMLKTRSLSIFANMVKLTFCLTVRQQRHL